MWRDFRLAKDEGGVKRYYKLKTPEIVINRESIERYKRNGMMHWYISLSGAAFLFLLSLTIALVALDLFQGSVRHKEENRRSVGKTAETKEKDDGVCKKFEEV